MIGKHFQLEKILGISNKSTIKIGTFRQHFQGIIDSYYKTVGIRFNQPSLRARQTTFYFQKLHFL